VINLERYGNTSTASIPLAAVEAITDGRIQPGDRIVFVGFGAGLTWGALLAQWTGPLPAEKPKMWPYRLHGLYRLYVKLRSWGLRIVRLVEGMVWGQRDK